MLPTRGALTSCLCTALLGALLIAHRAAHAATSTTVLGPRRPLPTYQGVTLHEGSVPPGRAQSSEARLPVGEERRARLTAEFNAARVVQRQMAVFDRECGCTKLILQRQAQLHASLERVTVLDGSHFRWEGLGNSGVRWMGLMRWALATGRATYLRLTQDCNGAGQKQAHRPSSGRPSDATCHLDPGDYFTGWGGVDWRWGASTERRVAERMAQRGEEEVVLHYECVKRQAPGCGVAALRFANGSRVVLREPDEMLHFFRTTPHRYIRLKLLQQETLEHSYSKPESLRDVLPLTVCPVAGGPAFSSRELVLKCETFGLMQPRPRLMRALMPALRRLEPYDVLVGVHLRTGYADWQFRNSERSFEGGVELREATNPRQRLLQHWRRLDSFLRDCRQAGEGPCFNWESPGSGRAPTVEDAMSCRVGGSQPTFALTAEQAPQGTLAALLTCAARLGESLAAARRGDLPAAAAAAAGDASGGASAAPRWGLLVLSDSPALPSLAAHLPALQGLAAGGVVTTHGLGRIGHSSFTKSCSGTAGKCDYGKDPGGTWTRSMVDFYLAGVVDGFAKALFTSFIWATMRRNLLCCRPGAFVQWMAWYNLTRTHRDKPMLDREFMHALEMTHEEPGEQEEADRAAAGRAAAETADGATGVDG